MDIGTFFIIVLLLLGVVVFLPRIKDWLKEMMK